MNSITPARDPVSEPIAALLEVFGAQADSLCFPDVDHPTLQRLAAELRQAAAQAERAEEALAQAQQELEARRAALQSRAVRGLAYAKVFAQDDAALLERLERLELRPRPSRATPRRPAAKRGRPRRTRTSETDDTVTELFGAKDADAEEGDRAADARAADAH